MIMTGGSLLGPQVRQDILDKHPNIRYIRLVKIDSTREYSYGDTLNAPDNFLERELGIKKGGGVYFPIHFHPWLPN